VLHKDLYESYRTCIQLLGGFRDHLRTVSERRGKKITASSC